MPNSHGWPDPARPCVPINPEQAGPHLLIDEHGAKRWAWWIPTSDKLGGTWMHATGGGWNVDWGYVGPAGEPATPARFPSQVGQPSPGPQRLRAVRMAWREG